MNLATIILTELGNNETVRQASEQAYGAPVFLEAKNGARAIDFGAIITLITKFAPLLPLIVGIFAPGAFSIPALIAVITAILGAFGVAQAQAEEAARSIASSVMASMDGPLDNQLP
jgi:hypothetical protein